MWFRFPEGYDNISVQMQHFSAEAIDAEGRGYFRAPNHFAPLILSTNLGFEADVIPPEGSPDDLPKADPLRDGAIAELTALSEAQKQEIANLRSDLEVMRSQVVVLTNERNMLADKGREQAKLIEGLQEQLEDKA